jgi:hypothetical protein
LRSNIYLIMKLEELNSTKQSLVKQRNDSFIRLTELDGALRLINEMIEYENNQLLIKVEKDKNAEYPIID